MRLARLLTFLGILALAVSLAWAGDPWKEKPWTEWTVREAKRIQEKSPWAKKVEFGSFDRTLPDYASTVPAFSSTVSWFSSLTYQESAMRLGQFHNPSPFNVEDAKQTLSRLPEHYIIHAWASTIPNSRNIRYLAGMRWFNQLTDDARRKAVYLKPKRSKRKVFPVRVEFDLRGHALAAKFYFLRELDGEPVIGPMEKKVEFVWPLHGFVIRTDFDLRKMVRNGKPDL